MKTSTMRAKSLMPSIGRIMIALAAASVIGGTAVRPAFADGTDGNDKRAERQDKNRRDEQRRPDQNRRGERDRDPRYYRQPVYPIYAPPPVYYAPEQSPGIRLFFPLEIRIR